MKDMYDPPTMTRLLDVPDISAAAILAAGISAEDYSVSWEGEEGSWILHPKEECEHPIELPDSWEVRLALIAIFGPDFASELSYDVYTEFPKAVVYHFKLAVIDIKALKNELIENLSSERKLEGVARVLRNLENDHPWLKALSHASLFIHGEVI